MTNLVWIARQRMDEKDTIKEHMSVLTLDRRLPSDSVKSLGS